MKIHHLTNSPWAATGYGAQAKLFIPRIAELGHEQTMTAFYGLEGAPLTWNGMRVYPRAFHPYGQDIVGANAVHAGADIILSLLDAWVCEPKGYGKTPWAAWFPIDSEPIPPPVADVVRQARWPIVMSEFGKRMAEQAGIKSHYVPHGVDTKVFHDMGNQRDMLKWPKDKFIVGMVAANKGNPSRKAFVENIAAFRMFQKKHPDAWLYLHTYMSERGENSGVNLTEYMDSLGMERGRDYGVCDQYNYIMSFPESYMAAAYSSMDVHMLVSMGEGFGIPTLEAQACGTPVVVGDWTAMSELCFAGWKVDKQDAQPVWTPLAAYQYTPRAEAIADKLDEAYKTAGRMRKDAREGAMQYDADKVTKEYWQPVLAEIEKQVTK